MIKKFKIYNSILENAGEIYKDKINLEKSDKNLNLQKNLLYFNPDAFGFGLNNQTNTIELTAMSDNHMYLYNLDNGSFKSSTMNRHTTQLPGRIWLDSKIISYYGVPSPSELNGNISKLIDTISKLLKIIKNTTNYDTYVNKYAKYVNQLTNIVNNKLSDYYLETREMKKYENGFKEEFHIFIKVDKYLKSVNKGQKATKSEMDKEHTKSPLLKKERIVPKGVGSKKKNSLKQNAIKMGISVGESIKTLKKINIMKHIKLFEDWDVNAAPLSKGEKLINTVESHGLSVGDNVIIPQFKYGNETLTDIKGTIKQIQLSYVNEQPQYHYNIYFDTPIGNEKQVKRDSWMFGPYGKTTIIKKIN